jgi:hypothetical protein
MNSLKEGAMWHIDLLLCTDYQMGGYNRAVSGQWCSKHVPVAMQQILNKATAGLNNRRAVFYVVHVEMLQARDKVS